MAAASGTETQAVLDELSNEIERLNQENEALRQGVQLLTQRLFGRRSEKGVPVMEQGVLPFEPAAAGPVQAETTVGVSGLAGRGGVRLHLVAQSGRAAEDAGRLAWLSPGGRGARL